jgi:two-component system response regulator HydG
MTVLSDYDWPGNVRELENCIQQMVAVNSGPLLHVDDLPSPVQNFRRQRNMIAMAAAVSSGSGPSTGTKSLQEGCPVIPLVTLERQMIRCALEYTKGDRGYAAYLLGIGRTTLYRKLKEIAASEEAR